MSSQPSEASQDSPFRIEAARFARSLAVGGGGTALDFATLMVGIRLLHLDATWARVLGLCIGGVALFFGSRSFAFRAQAEGAGPQATRFIVSELIGFPLNVLIFRLLLRELPAVAPEVLSLAANFALFASYYYPVRSLIVFKAKPTLPRSVVAVMVR